MFKSPPFVPILLPFTRLSLVLAILTGLVRLGWGTSIFETAGQHGALMLGSFLGTVILLERAVVFRNGRALLAPALNDSGRAC
ncbi:hypothetical protein [Spirosoma pollinicola]|uniref:hypothetical protein n=1 Tax=Spirosoma pollinicola TaxID=2057025 RepID=UPI001F0CD3F6|nr:hypothetical protein [Spirosoma pollinicola]